MVAERGEGLLEFMSWDRATVRLFTHSTETCEETERPNTQRKEPEASLPMREGRRIPFSSGLG